MCDTFLKIPDILPIFNQIWALGRAESIPEILKAGPVSNLY